MYLAIPTIAAAEVAKTTGLARESAKDTTIIRQASNATPTTKFWNACSVATEAVPNDHAVMASTTKGVHIMGRSLIQGNEVSPAVTITVAPTAARELSRL